MKAKLVIEGKEFPIEINDPELQKLVAPPKKNGYELVGYGHTYSFVDNYGDVVTLDHQDQDDNNRYEEANYYSDRIVAENNARVDKLMRQLRRFAVFQRDKTPDWHNTKAMKWYIVFDYDENDLFINNCYFRRAPFCIYFHSRECAQAAIDLFHDELIWYFAEYKDSL